MRKVYSIFLLLSVAGAVAFAQAPKREMRAVWFTTWLSDFTSTRVPVATGSNEAARETARTAQKDNLIATLNSLQQTNINVVCFHVRPFCDAIYKSSYEPWSEYISAQRGSDPGWDPLEFVIEEAHKRGMELHAWLNPYRYSTNSANRNTPLDYVNTHPDWLLNYSSTYRCLNPGKPEVIQRIADIIGEIVTNYDVDGIVFDDYFYMDRAHPDAIDQTEYNLYNPDKLSRADWRRANVNKMVKAVYDRIQSIHPYVTFGISPAGVAASDKNVATKYGLVPDPGPCPGTDWQYNQIFSEPVAWLKEGTIDYISPQIYSALGLDNYEGLCKWWSQVANKFGKHFYSSQDVFTVSGTSPALGAQINYNRNYDLNDAPGSIFFRSNDVKLVNVKNYLTANHYRYKALPPVIGWKPAESQGMVENLVLSGQTLSWTYSKEKLRYVIYAVPKSETGPQVFASALYIQGISYAKQFTLPTGIDASTHRIAVSVLDRYGNLSAPRVMSESLATPVAATLIAPANNASVVQPTLFTWGAVPGACQYVWQMSRNAGFTDLIDSRETTNLYFASSALGDLEDNITYYWRVKAIAANAGNTWSETRSFNSKNFRITSPANGALNVPLAPVITWPDLGTGVNYTLEIFSNSQLSTLAYSVTVQTTSHTVPEGELEHGSTFYARIKFSGVFGGFSPTTTFTLFEKEIPIPRIISPINESTVAGTSIAVSWAEQVAKGFRVQLSASSSFPPAGTQLKTTGATVFTTQFTGLAAGEYYVRVAAQKTSSITDYSAAVRIKVTGDSSVEEVTYQTLNAYVADGNLVIQSERPCPVSAAIYNFQGQLLAAFDCSLQTGKNIVPINVDELSKGVYLIRLQTSERCLTLKMKW